MEEVEVGLLEGGIGWLAETIMQNLDAGKLDDWIRQVGLADDTKKLRSEIERVEVVVADVKGRAIGNRSLARSLGRLRELLYDADDAIDELDYYSLQQQVEGDACQGAPESVDGHGGGAEQTERPWVNAGTRRSGVWQHFEIVEEKNGKPAKAKCVDCGTVVKCGSDNGTSVLHNHRNSGKCKRKRGATDQPPNLPSASEGVVIGNSAATGNSVGRKRMRTEEVSTYHVAANSHPWNKTELSNRIKQMTHQLQEAMNEVMRLSGSASSNQSRQSTPPATNATTSSYLLEPKVYGRDAEMESIKNMIMGNKSNGITVLPIVGIGGIGKTTLSQRVYNDPEIGNQFDIKIWVHVSVKFDVVRITRDILECVSHQSYQGISNFNMLQQDLEIHMKSKKFLIVLDDVWDVTTENCWNKLLGPLRPNHVNGSEEVTGNMIIVTTRILTVAERCGTAGSINLEALEDGDIWSLFKAYAFGNNNPHRYTSLQVLGKQIVRELNGNPLAVKTVGRLLSRNLTIGNWNNIIEHKEWQSLEHTDGIMYVLKSSYDHLPRNLQKCFSYCSIFPQGYSFSKAQLIQIWIAQGFVQKSSERLEQKGSKYLAELVDSGFYQQRRSSSEHFVMHDLMHDLAKLVSQTECATIDGSECEELAPTIRHLSVLTDTAYSKNEELEVSRNEEFERRLLKVRSRSKLRTLVFIGDYDSHFLKSFQDAFKEAKHLRLLLHITSMYAGFDPFISSLVNPLKHLRYLRDLNNLYVELEEVLLFSENDEEFHKDLPRSLSKCYHLQVLDIGSFGIPNKPNDINNLVSLRHLVAQKDVCSSIASIGKMTSLMELTSFKVENAIGFEITQLQRMSELVELGVSRLENVRTKQEASGASLKDKHHLERLHLFWKGVRNGYDSDGNYNEYDSDLSSESENDSDRSSENECDGDMIPEPSMHSETEGERLQMTDSNGAPSLDHIPDIASEVLEGLEPHCNLKYLRISWYNGAKAPTWFDTSLTYLQTLRLEKCGEWKRLSLERLSLLRKLVLIEMKNASVLSIRSPEEIILIGMQKLHTCFCTSTVDLNSSLRVLKIERCPVLKVFPLFEDCQKFEIEQKSWLSHLSKLIIHDCPHLYVHNPVPPSTITLELSIINVSTLPMLKGSSNGTLTIHPPNDDNDAPDKLIALDDNVMSFHNLRFLTGLEIYGFHNPTSISFHGLRQLICLKTLEIYYCPELLSSNVPLERTSEYVSGANHSALPSLERLHIKNCGITGKWLSLMLQHVQALQELSLEGCQQITGLSIGEEENSQPNLMPAMEDPSLGYPDRDKLLCLPLNLISSLKTASITSCYGLTFYGSKEDFVGFTSLEELVISQCPKLLSFLAHNDGNDELSNGRWFLPLSLGELEIGDIDSPKTLQLCFPGNLTRLKKLEVRENESLTSLKLHSCTALQELKIEWCWSLNSLEGLQSLDNLRLLRAYRCLSGYGEYGRCILPQSLEELYIGEYSQETLQPCFQKNLTCLKTLDVSDTASLKSLELQSCTGLEHLKIEGCASLATLNGLEFLHALRHLEVYGCPSLPPYLGSLSQLERLQIDDPSILATSFCKHLTSLQRLELYGCGSEVVRLTDEQERALNLLMSLQELLFMFYDNLIDLPTGLHSLPSLKRLDIWGCNSIARLPEKGLPPSLEELDIGYCSEELAQQCRTLASKLKVKIGGRYVN